MLAMTDAPLSNASSRDAEQSLIQPTPGEKLAIDEPLSSHGSAGGPYAPSPRSGGVGALGVHSPASPKQRLDAAAVQVEEAALGRGNPAKSVTASKASKALVPIIYVISICVGLCATTQAAVNGRLGSTVGSGIFACVFSYAGGALVAFVLRTIEMCWNRERRLLQCHGKLRIWQLVGGLFGAFYVTSAALLTPIIGFAMFFVMFVFGQLVCSTIADHVGLLGSPVFRFNWITAVGLTVTVTGAVLSVIEQLDHLGGTHVGLIILYCFIALLSGVAIPCQAMVNRHLVDVVRSKLSSNLVSFVAGNLGVLTVSIVVALIDNERFNLLKDHLKDSEWWMFLGGPLGIAFVLCGILFIRIIGVSMFFTLVVAGQLMSSLFYDNFGAFGTAVIKATALRIAGVAAVYVGLVLSKLAQRHAAKQKERAAKASQLEDPLLSTSIQ